MERRASLGLAALALGVAAAPLAAQSACPASFTGFAQLEEGTSTICVCASEQTETGSVWGSDRYTADSSLCRAARHAGAIDGSGGEVTVWAFGGCSEFEGSARSEVETSDWGAYGRSFAFAPDVPCGGERPAGEPPRCPDDARGLRDREAASGFECHCSERAIGGAVWGTDLYTLDSSVCAAARHAGAIDAAGGAVTLFVGGGCPSFEGSARNGIQTGDWGPYEGAFAFGYPLPACADGSEPAG